MRQMQVDVIDRSVGPVKVSRESAGDMVSESVGLYERNNPMKGALDSLEFHISFHTWGDAMRFRVAMQDHFGQDQSEQNLSG